MTTEGFFSQFGNVRKIVHIFDLGPGAVHLEGTQGPVIDLESAKLCKMRIAMVV